MRALEIYKNKICFDDVKKEDKYFVLYKILTNLYVCDPEYVVPVFNLICKKNNSTNFKKFLTYFETQYIEKIDIKSWNYNDDLTHATNNSCESYNCKLKNYLKPNLLFLSYYMSLD